MPDILYILIVCAAAFGIDWALYNGAYRSIQAFYRVPDGINYQHFLFPRVILTLCAGAIISISTLDGKPNIPLAMTGFAIFLTASVYAQIRTFLKSERYKDDNEV